MNTPLWFAGNVPAPRIGVSACLAGQRVRYDGTDKRSSDLYTHIAPYAELIPLCPEASLGIPRPPIHLQHTHEGLRAIGVDDPTLDVTQTLLAFNDAQRDTLSRLCGVILKARSPSCGIGSATHASTHGETQPGDGVFAGFIRQHFPWLPLCDEATLEKPEQARQFLIQATLLSDAHKALATHRLDQFLQHHENQTHSSEADILFSQLHRHRRLTP